MGVYIPSASAGQYSICSVETAVVELSTVAADKTWAITLPAALFGTIKAAYIDLVLPQVKDDAGLANYIDGAQVIKIGDGATEINPLYDVPTLALYTLANVSRTGARLAGYIDISSIAVAGATLTVTWINAKSKGVHLEIRDSYLEVRFITG